MSDPVIVKARYVGGGIFSLREGRDKFSACLVLEDGEQQKIEKIRDEAVKEKLGDKPGKFTDYTLSEGDDEEYEASFGKVFINPKSKTAPRVFRKSGGETIEATKEDIYAGCYVYASVSAYSMPKQPGKGEGGKGIPAFVTLNLESLCKWKDGERLGRAPSTGSEFDELETEDIDAEAAGAGMDDLM